LKITLYVAYDNARNAVANVDVVGLAAGRVTHLGCLNEKRILEKIEPLQFLLPNNICVVRPNIDISCK
jgi:hypothetical protein